MNVNNLTPTERVFANALIIGLITFFSQLVTVGWPPTIQTVYIAFIGSMLALLMQIKILFNPQTLKENKKQPPLGMLI